MKKSFFLSVALATFLSMNTTNFIASASTVKNSNDTQNFISSLNDSEKRLANAFLSSGYSLDETSDLISAYKNGTKKITRTRNRTYPTNTNFYSGVNLSENQHYAVIIKNNGSTSESVNLKLGYNDNWIGFTSTSPVEYRLLNQSANMSVTHQTVAGSKEILMSGYIPSTTSLSVPAGVIELPFNVIVNNPIGNEQKTESSLYHKLTFQRLYNYVINGVDTTFCMETYVRGDVNHDGIVDEVDVTYLSNYLIGDIEELAFSYTDKSDYVTKIVNDLAMDTNKNGEADLSDLAWIMKHKEN